MTAGPLRLINGDAAPAARIPDSELAGVARAAVAGDRRAIASLAARFDRILRATAGAYGLDHWDVDDVVQHTWMRFLEHGRSVREPVAIGGWLITTARRYSLRVLQGRVRERLSDDPAIDVAGDDGELDGELLAGEARAALYTSLARLSDRQRELMTLLLAEPNLSYDEVGRRLGLPVGSIGPTRARSLARLRRDRALQALR